MFCLQFSNNNGFTVTDPGFPPEYDDSSYAVITNNIGSNFSILVTGKTIPGTFRFKCEGTQVYFLVIMNPSLSDSLIISANKGEVLIATPSSSNQQASSWIGCKNFYDGQGQKCYSGFNITFATSNGQNIPADYIKIVVTTYPFDFACWPYSQSGNSTTTGFYVTDIGLDWTTYKNYGFYDGKLTYSQKANLLLSENNKTYAISVKNNFPLTAQNEKNKVIIYGSFGNPKPGTSAQQVLPSQNLTTGGLFEKVNVVFESVDFDPNLPPNVDVIAWRGVKEKGATFLLRDYSTPRAYFDYAIDGYYSFVDANSYSFQFDVILTVLTVIATASVDIRMDYTYIQIVNYDPYNFKENRKYEYWASPTVKIVKLDGTIYNSSLAVPYKSRVFFNLKQGEVLTIEQPSLRKLRPGLNSSDGQFYGTITVTVIGPTPYPTASPAPTQATPTPTPSPTATMGPTPSPSGTEPTGTPYPTVTPLPAVAPGRMWFAGNNVNGQLGTNNEISYSSPVQSIVGGLWKSVEAGTQGFYNTIGAIKDDNTLWIWGQFTYSGVNLSSPIQVVGGGSWLQISQNYALKSDGTIWGWNLNQPGQPFGWASSPIQVSNWGGNWIYFNMPSLGVNNFVGIKNDRTLWCAGQNDYGQFGTNYTSSPGVLISSPVQTVFRTNDWRKIVNDSFYAVALKMNGTIWTWGRNNYGQLGINSTVNKSTPVQVGSENNWVDIACNTFSSFGLKNDGSFWCIGSLGTGSSPVQMMTSYNNIWKNIVSLPYQGWNFILLDDQNNAWSWYADNYFGELGNNDTWQIAPPEPLQLFTAGSNTKWMTGTNNNLTRGVYPSNYYSAFTVLIEDVNPTVTPTNSPTPAATDPSPTPTPTIATATPTPSSSATPTSTPTLSPQPTPSPTPSGSPYPTPFPTTSPTPTLPPLILVDDNNLINFNNINLNSDSQSIVFSNYAYKIAQPYLRVLFLESGYANVSVTQTDSLVTPIDGLLTISPDGSSIETFNVEYGSVITWQGQVTSSGFVLLNLNVSPSTIADYTLNGNVYFSKLAPDPTPTPAPTLNSLEPKNGRLFVWGNNSYGQLGQGNSTSISSPVQTLYSTTDWNSCDVKFSHILSVKDNGQIWVWGSNSYGQLGLNNTISYSSPVQTAIDNSNWNFISAGYEFSMAVDQLGQIWSWGKNNYGQLGINSDINTSSPVLILGAAYQTCKKISAGYSHCAAILDDYSLLLWGDNSYGACSYSDIPSFSTPIQVQLSVEFEWENVTCGKHYTLAVQKNGKMWAWGLNDNGQYGNGSVVTSSNPVLIESGSAAWNFISAGEKFSVGGVNSPIGTPVPTVTPTPSPTPSATFDYPTPTPAPT
jgi:alpha-tubulin suppressor-like RCC1 family protein